MQNEDNTCIKYLMKELDPSEAVLIERRMMEDEDFLIEVECMRKTLQRLENLPHLNPPSNLTNQICQQAGEYHSSRQYGPSSFLPHIPSIHSKYYAAAAAVVAFSVAFGVLTFTETDEKSGAQTASTQNQATTVETAQFGTTATNQAQPQSSQAAPGDDIQPWVDRNDVLHFQAGSPKNAAQLDSAIQQSMQKLKPIGQPVYNLFNSPSYRLTGGPAQ